MEEKENTFSSKIKQFFPTSTSGNSRFFIESIKIIFLAGITVFFVRYFLFKPFYVKGASMEPNFYGQEYLIVDEISYRFNEPKRGDVIVFKYPENQKESFLKRIIGLPGERVKITDGKVTVYNKEYPEGMILKENYLPSELVTIGERNTTLSENQYFVLGDNRGNSRDSRSFGPIHKSLIIGKVAVRGWPLNRIQTFKTPDFTIHSITE